MMLNAFTAIAKQEFVVCLRGRWIVVFSIVFAALSLAIAYFGTVTAGAAGLQGFERTTASLLNLVLYLVPLLGLALGTLNISREHESNELLFSQPLSRARIVCGRLLGLFAATATALLAGFGVAALVIFLQIGSEGLVRFSALVLLSTMLAAVYLTVGALVGLRFDSRTKALGISLVLWFFFVFLYDLLVIGAVFLVPERTANLLIFLSVFGNPVDLARVSSLLAVGDATIFGAAGAALLKFLGGAARSQAALIGMLCIWFTAGLFATVKTIRHLDL
jgi:Cu-processing system permease protein